MMMVEPQWMSTGIGWLLVPVSVSLGFDCNRECHHTSDGDCQSSIQTSGSGLVGSAGQLVAWLVYNTAIHCPSCNTDQGVYGPCMLACCYVTVTVEETLKAW